MARPSYIKDDHELNQFLLKMALDEAAVVPKAGAEAITGAALEAMAREYLLAEAVINRLDHLVNPEVLHPLSMPILSSTFRTKQRRRPRPANCRSASITASDPRPLRRGARTLQQLRVEKMHHGNLKVGVIDEDLLISGDWAQLMKTAGCSPASSVPAAMPSVAKKSPVVGFAQAMNWLLAEVERTVSKQRYKGPR